MFDQLLEIESAKGSILDEWLEKGWYRMYNFIYTSHYKIDDHFNIRPIWWLRYPVAELIEHPSHRRIRKKCRHLRYRIDPFALTEDLETLYDTYYKSIQFDGYASIDYALGLYTQKDIFDSFVIRIYEDENLVAAGIFDMGEKTATSILHFYDPAVAHYSPGKYLILLTIEHIRNQQINWYYPGYVIPGFTRFNYKLFLGKEVAQYFDPKENKWLPFTDELIDERLKIEVSDIPQTDKSNIGLKPYD